ncbi:MAG: metal-sulfur cluster assembly factor [Candidatus Abyssobacteria bacterium SURF_5]|uniref:Metal-sulfur cluster assembly factor n=1 Tax=Abyssobacteria bacterium (strain SURF_5) TaxID=2093360 RepID=A0A3A4P0C3_ABYX5|nr:MAG: metal-sulfur cluster assembly factor [Candidatus Abyssubacteria bacterium SURF_5]
MTLKDHIMRGLAQVIDPETGLNVVRMGLVHEVSIDETQGNVHVLFRPTSYFCPLAFRLAVDIRDALKAVPGVNSAKVEVADFIHARELNQVLSGGKARNSEMRET